MVTMQIPSPRIYNHALHNDILVMDQMMDRMYNGGPIRS